MMPPKGFKRPDPRRPIAIALRDAGKKKCSRCHRIKSTAHFNKDKATLTGFSAYCRRCASIRGKIEWKNGRAIKQTDYYLRRYYKISLADYDELFKQQDSKCAICEKRPFSGKRFPVDHCHTTGRVRGILCDECNRGIGMLKDDPRILQNALAYLQRSITQAFRLSGG